MSGAPSPCHDLAWLPIDTAPKGTMVIGARFGRYPYLGRVWWQPEFSAWISGCRQMTMAPGYTIDGAASKLHSPDVQEVTHWLPLPPNPTGIDQ